MPNGFVNIDLGEHLDAAENKNVLIADVMTRICACFTSERAFLRSNRPSVVADACVTRPLQTAVSDASSEQLHSALAAIADLFAVVVRCGSSLR